MSDTEDVVRRGEFSAVRELHTERHGTLMLRLDALEAKLVAQKEVQELTNKALEKTIDGLGHKMVLQTLVLALLVAVNAPGLMSFVTKGSGH